MSKPPTVHYGLRRGRRFSTLSLCPYYSQTQNTRPVDEYFLCRDPDLNWGHPHFQCDALPTELPWHRVRECRAAVGKCQESTVFRRAEYRGLLRVSKRCKVFFTTEESEETQRAQREV